MYSTQSSADELCTAASKGDLPKCRHLIEKLGVDKNGTTTTMFSSESSALQAACAIRHLHVVKYLVEEAKVDLTSRDSNGHTALHTAALNSPLEFVRYLVEVAKMDVHARTNRGETPLHLAASGGFTEVVKYLIDECHLDVNETTTDGSASFLMAAPYGRLDNMRCLFESGKIKDVNVKRSTDGLTALHVAAQEATKFEVVQYLVEVAKADVNVKDLRGETPLHLAAHGRDPNRFACSDETARLRIIQYLLEAGKADARGTTNDGWAVLRQAAFQGHSEIVRDLVKSAHDGDEVTTKEGETPLDLGKDEHKESVIKYLTDNQ